MAGTPNSSWTAEEDQDALDLGFDEFSRMHPHRTWNAYRFRKGRIQRRQRLDATTTEPIGSAKPDPREEDWEALFTSLVQADSVRASLDPTDEKADVTAPVDGPVGVAFFSDIHAGAQGVDYKRLNDDVLTLRDTEGLYGVINGDLWEAAKPQMKSGNALYHGLFNSPREQYEYTRWQLAPATGKWIAITQGNHDARDGMVAGVDRLPDLCAALDAYYFTERGGTVYLTVGSVVYVLVVKHQYLGHSNVTKSNSNRRLWQEWPHAWESADVIATAHFHEPDTYHTSQRGRDVVWLRSGTYKAHDPWSESKGYKPRYGVPIVIFDPTERKMTTFHHFDDGVAFLRAVRGT